MAKANEKEAWLDDFESASQACTNLHAQLKEKEWQGGGLGAASTLRTHVAQLSMRIALLDDVLYKMSEAKSEYRITENEVRRREELLAKLQSRRDDLVALMNQVGKKRAYAARGIARQEQEDGLGGSACGARDDEVDSIWKPYASHASRASVAKETEESARLNNAELLMVQDDKFYEQDDKLDRLSGTVGQMKNVATLLGDELGAQEDVITDLEHGVEHTNERVKNETRRIDTLTEASATTCYWMLIVALFVLIIVLLFL
eukprot:TRINITY_DN5359_c0_g1_i1.p1 TRINITY_DN5359_c0_g1~~TRINITY_DN5359_c0_g1_i1.p1  ORF type:complete len:260 (-),score=85.61 TRINITY_DN5359_c0_g1_i1:155-934(-)